MNRLLRCAVATPAVAGLLVIAPPPATAGTTDFRIQVYCNDSNGAFPLPGVRVELWRRRLDQLPKFVTDTLVHVAHASDDGRVGIRVRGDDDDFYFRIVLADNKGVRAEDHAYPWAWFADTDTNQNDVPVQDYGTIGLGDGTGHPPCTAYEGVRRAYQDYIAQTGEKPPFDVTVQLDSPGRSVPGATMNEIKWPENWRESDPADAAAFTAAHHEFAHAIRDWYDGDSDHRDDDAERYGYGQSHNTCTRSNEGFAFQEGWAEFWAKQGASQCPGAALTDFSIEGHVNLGLTAIEHLCMTRAQMVDVLKRNWGGIHSFAEFARAANCENRAITPYKPGFGDIEVRPSLDVTTSLAKQRVIGWKRDRRQYATTWAKAVKVADRPGKSGLAIAIAPGLAKLQRDQLGLLVKSYGFQRSGKATAALGPPGSAQFERALREIDRKYKRKALALAQPALRALTKAARPYAGKAGRDGRTVAKRLRSLRRDLAHGRIPVGLLPASDDQVAVLQAPSTGGGKCVIYRDGRRECT